MTQAKAQTVASALIGLGYVVQVQNISGDWRVTVSSPGNSVDVSAVSNFATQQGIIGEVTTALFR